MATNRDHAPQEEDLRKLPRWAIVAFAARCARRVQPLFAKYWKDAPKEHIEAVDRAITLSEASARVGRPEASLSDAADAARVAAAAYAAVDAAAYAAADAADAAAYAAVDARAAADAAVDARAAARAAAYAAARAAADAADAAAWSDYDRLLELATAERWAHDAPVDPDRLGPLWPSGEPQGWPTAHTPPREPDPSREHTRAFKRAVMDAVMRDVARESSVRRLGIGIDVGEFTPADEASDLLAQLYDALNRYHIASGGSGLTVEDWRVLSASCVGVGGGGGGGA